MNLKNEQTIHQKRNLVIRRKKKQKSYFLGAIAGTILTQVGTQLSSGLVNKIFGGQKRKSKKEKEKGNWELLDEKDHDEMPTRSNIILRKRAIPKPVKLPNGYVFYVK